MITSKISGIRLGIFKNVNNNKKLFMPPWLAADAAGAIVAGGTSAALQASRGSVSWSSVGQTALLGGVASSCGVTAKLTSWFKKWF